MADALKISFLVTLLLVFVRYTSSACKQHALTEEALPVPYDKYALAELPSKSQMLVKYFIKEGLLKWNRESHDGRNLRSSNNVLNVFVKVCIEYSHVQYLKDKFRNTAASSCSKYVIVVLFQCLVCSFYRSFYLCGINL